MRFFALLLAATVLSAEAPPPDIEKFGQAIEASHFKDARSIIDKVIEQRTPKDGQPHPDALLNSLFGRLLMAGHETDAAATYLAHAPLNELPATVRAETALAYGRALEMKGDWQGALQTYRNASTASGTDFERRQATLGVARQLLVANPAAAREQSLGIATGPAVPERWEARYLLSLASSLLGDTASASRLADEAWVDALVAPGRAAAPLHVATLRAGLAAARHDVPAERAMLAATNGLNSTATDNLSAQLPVCGDDGLAPSDFVIFGVVAAPYATRNLVPIAASRAAAVAPFYSRLAGVSLIKEATGRSPIGTVVTVRCRSSVRGSFTSKPLRDDPLLGWFVERGLFPAVATNDTEDSNVNAAAARIDALERRFGKQSILLIAPKWQLLNLLEMRASAGDQVLPGQLSDLRAEIAGGLLRAGADPWLAHAVDWQAKGRQIQQTATDPSAVVNLMEGYLRDQLMNAPFEMARGLVTEMLENSPGDDPPAPASRLVLALNARTPKSFTGRERQAWLLTVARAQRALGMEQDAHTTVVSAGLEKELCVAADTPAKLLEQHFTYEDYPEELIAGEQEGAVLFDFDLTPTGSVANPRIIYSLPSGLFDEPSAKGIATIRYTPAKRAGKPAACRGISQPVKWQLEDENEFRMPTPTPQAPNETT